MAIENPETNSDRGEDERIGELEAQVKELSGLVEILLSKGGDDLSVPVVEEEQVPADVSDHKHHLVEDVKDGIGRALGGVEGESLESRIGGIWLSRMVAVLFMTLMVLGGVITLQEEALGAMYKIGIGYGVSALAIGYGLALRRSESFFPQTILGSGLAAFYFTTYAGFFLENTKVFSSPSLGIPALACALLIIAAVAHLRRSATAAGISLFLIYYTVVLSLSTSMDNDSVVYALITGSLLAIVALTFHVTHRWMLFTWGALIATQLTYIYFFVINPPQLGFSDETYFWYSNAFLTLVFCVFSAACITDASRTGEFRRAVGPMAGVNSFVYLALTWMSIRANYAEYEWAFRLWQTGLFLVFTGYARLVGPRRNYLFQIFAAKTLIIFTLALQASLSHEWLLVAMSLECLALGFSYMRSGLVVFKLLGLGLLLVTLVGCLFSANLTNQIEILGYTLEAKWFSCLAVPLVFAVVAWFHEHFVRRVPPEAREVKGQWFLADTWADLSGSAMAMLYAASGALILMSITIIDLGDLPSMPYILAGEGIAMAVLGLLLATPPVEVASVLLLFASHVCYHIFLWVGKEGFETQPRYALYTSIVAGVTFFGGYLWERYQRRIQGGTQFEHDAMASIPYLAATIMLATLMGRQLEPLYAPLAQMVLAAGLFLASAATMLVGFRVAGVVGLAIGTGSYYASLYDVREPITEHPDFVIGLLVVMICYAAAERAGGLWDYRRQATSRPGALLRTVIVAVATAIGLLALFLWAPAEQLTFYWLALAMGAMILGVVFRESRYRWAGIALYFGTAIRFGLHDLRSLQPLLRFTILAALVASGLILAWAYSEFRERQLRKLREEHLAGASSDDAARDGHTADG